MPRRAARADHTEAARRLFAQFAERHRLKWEEDDKAPVEVLQNEDELHFGVGALQAGLFPFEAVRDGFVAILDDWIAGRARIAPAFWGAKLQRWLGGRWETVYVGRTLFGWGETTRSILRNIEPQDGDPD